MLAQKFAVMAGHIEVELKQEASKLRDKRVIHLHGSDV